MNIPLLFTRIKKPFVFVALFLFMFFAALRLPLFQSSSVLGLTSGVRYKDKVFTDVIVTKNVTYGSAIPYGSNTAISLKMDIYQPKDDPVSSRPVIILVHPGGFVGGSKEQWGPDVFDWGNEFARRGYVVLAINYRLMSNWTFSMNAPLLPTAIKQAKEDTFAAVRWSRAHASQYKIDTNKIAVGGYSAGAITSLYVAYDSANVGSSGNPGQSSTIKTAFSMAGGMLQADLDTIATGDPSSLLIHGTADTVVPVTFSQQVDNKLSQKNVPHTAYYYSGADHAVYTQTTVFPRIVNYLYTSLDLNVPSPSISPSPSPSPSPSASPSPSPSVSPSVTITGTVTVTPSSSPSVTATAPPVGSASPSASVRVSITHTITDTGIGDGNVFVYLGGVLYALGILSIVGEKALGKRLEKAG